ncbi:MAG: OmpA family protein [candidate division Zixibacteria bacterium]|nr:OmpA family protein [candidate division Zixibacteria bacterium]
MKRTIAVVLVMALMLVSVGCMSKKNQGALIGGTTGAVVGGLIGNKAGNTAVGAILGAAIGGVAGAYIGNYMDKQAAEMEKDIEGATIERVGEGIKITFDSGILFDVDKSNLQPVATENLNKLAVILNKYDDTEVLIEGHTDATGGEDHNLDLSLRRAQSVANSLSGQQVIATRLRIMGYGETQPVASNETDGGRQANRRVDIAIFANDKLKKVAKEQG